MSAPRLNLWPTWHPYATVLAFALLVTMTAVKLGPGFLSLFLFATVLAVRPSPSILTVPSLRQAPIFWSLVLFIAITALGAIWASNPIGALTKASESLLLLVGTMALVRCLHQAQGQTLWYLGRDAVHAAILAALVLTIELACGFPLTKVVLGLAPSQTWANNYLVPTADGILVSKSWLSRQMSMLALLFWPAMMIAALRTPSKSATITLFSFGLLGVAAIYLSEKDSAKVAIAAGAISWLATWYAPRLATLAAYVAWTLVCLLIVPVLLLLTPEHPDRWQWLPESGRARLEIWQRVSQSVLERPMFGIGADSTLVEELLRVQRANEARMKAHAQKVVVRPTQTLEEQKFSQLARTHPHNQFLQVWYEMGALGASAFLVMGLVIIGFFARLQRLPRAFGIATLASATSLATLTHSLWQEWYLTGFAWCFVLFSMGMTMYGARDTLQAVARQRLASTE